MMGQFSHNFRFRNSALKEQNISQPSRVLISLMTQSRGNFGCKSPSKNVDDTNANVTHIDCHQLLTLSCSPAPMVLTVDNAKIRRFDAFEFLFE